MKLAALAVCIAAVALGACRREVPYDNYGSMKLGAPAHADDAQR